MGKTILSKSGQLHSYENLVNIMQGLTPDEVKQVLIILGLDEIVDQDGGLAPAYTADIVSSEDRFLNPSISHNITLTGKLYNYYQDVSEKAVSWKWTRNSDSPESDKDWVKHTQVIQLTDADLTNKIQSQKVYFNLEVTIGDEKFLDVIDFSTVVTLNAVQINQSHGLFIGGDPAKITLTAITTGVAVGSYKWFVNNELKDVSRIYELPSSIVPNGKVANVRLEVIDTRGNTYSDFTSIPKMSNGKDGEPGVQGPPGSDGSPKYTWIKYADDDLGTNMSEYPTNLDGSFREYMGIAINKDTPTESNDCRDYTWSKYIGEDGVPGVPGSRGPMPRMLEWREGYTYYRNAEYRDYIYYRSTNPTYDGWYCVRDIPTNLYNTTAEGVKEYRAVGNTGSPDTNIFQKQDFVDSQVFGTIIAENANLAGFIFRNKMLVSQTQVGSVPKIILNGKTGYASFISAQISQSRLEEVEIENAIISNADIADTTILNAVFRDGKLEVFSDVIPSNTNKVAFTSEIKVKSDNGTKLNPSFTFFNNTGDEQSNWESSRSTVQVVGSIYRDGVLFVLAGLPNQSDITDPRVGGPNFPAGTVYKDSNGFLKVK